MPQVDQHRIRLFEDNSPEILLLHLGLSYNICNFRCHYCYLPNWRTSIDPKLSYKLDKLYEKLKIIKRPLYIIFASDGEISVTPALWPYLRKLLDLNDVRMVTIFTNLSQDLRKILDMFPGERMAIVATYHIHQFKNVEMQKVRFFRRVEKLKREVTSIVVSFVLSPDQLEHYVEFKDTTEKMGVLSYAYPLLSRYSGKVDFELYGREELKRVEEILALDDNPAKIINDFFFGMKVNGLRCAAGRDYIEVSPDGQIYRCYAICDGSYGNLFDPHGPLVNLKSEVCPLGGCSCNWAVAFSDSVSRNYKRINSLYNFVEKDSNDVGYQSLEVVN